MDKRVWHPFWNWEDLGMWRDVSKAEHQAFLPRAVEFTGNAEAYGSAMLAVLDQMPIACEHNLTERAMNRRAWIGHAAVYLQFECPEYITREAWRMLTDEQRAEADAKADAAIAVWEDRRLHSKMADARVSAHPGRGATETGRDRESPVVPADLSSDPIERRMPDIAGLFETADACLHGAQEG